MGWFASAVGKPRNAKRRRGFPGRRSSKSVRILLGCYPFVVPAKIAIDLAGEGVLNAFGFLESGLYEQESRAHGRDRDRGPGAEALSGMGSKRHRGFL